MLPNLINPARWLVISVLCLVILATAGSFDNRSNAGRQDHALPDPGPAAGSPLSRDAAPAQGKESAAALANGFELNKREPLLHKDLRRFEAVEVTATGYYAGYESTGKHPDHPQYGITYSGVKVRRDIFSTIAADLSVFPIGTILYIPGYGYGVVTDIGSAIQGRIIDLYFETKEQVYQEWGKQTLDVYVVRKGDGGISEEALDRLNDLSQVVVP